MDGFSARILKAYSPIGKELDSLADVISFGMAPSVAIFSLLSGTNVVYPSLLEPVKDYIPYLGFLIVLFSALRLARFNVDERQTNSFIGLATPANAMFWISLCGGIYQYQEISPAFVVAIILLIFVFSYLMNAELPMFSLKKRKLQWKGNEELILLIVFLILSISFFHLLGIAASVLFYVVLCVVFNKRQKQVEN